MIDDRVSPESFPSWHRHLGPVVLVFLYTLSSTGSALQNGDFEQPQAALGQIPLWETRLVGASMTLDTRIAHTGRQSLRVIPDTDTETVSLRMTQTLDPRRYDTELITLSAQFLTDAPGTDSEFGFIVRQTSNGRLLYVERRAAPLQSATEQWTRLAIDVPLVEAADAISIGIYKNGPDSLWLDSVSVSAVDLDVRAPPTAAAVAYLEYALDQMQQYSVVSRSIDWPSFRRQAQRLLRGAESRSDAHPAVKYALATLDDGHSYFMRAEQMARLDRGPVSNARTGRAVQQPMTALRDGIAYIRVPGFAGGRQQEQAAFAQQMQHAVAEFDDSSVCGWVVDLRSNRGGNLWPLLVGLGPLLPSGPLGTTVAPNQPEQSFWYSDGKAGLGDSVRLRIFDPAIRRSEAGPLAILFDSSTASAAEILALALSGRSNTRSFGEPTRGATTATRVLPLWDGAALVLAVAATRDRSGKLVDGPLIPDEQVHVSVGSTGLSRDTLTSRTLDSDRAFDQAAAWIREMRRCEPADLGRRAAQP